MNAPSSHPSPFSYDECLTKIRQPSDIAQLSLQEKEKLAQAVRSAIIQTVANNGGHLAPSLGVVELTLALLSVFTMPEDKIVWDVGHQSYAWKLLTGRAESFHTIRTHGGLSGFPKRSESPYDHFDVGHSSTSISAALGMAMARDLDGKNHHVLAVIGDGSLTAGLAFEGLNQAGQLGKRLIVVLNDNEMSISRNVGALSLFLSRNMSKGWARRARREVKDWLKSIPGIGDEMANYAHRTHSSLKNVFTPGMLFEAFGFNYIGPVNGHDQQALEAHLRTAASIDDQPVLLHVLTRKGKGYAPAEKEPSRFHGIGRFDVETGLSAKAAATAPTYTEIFGETLCDLAKVDERVVTITAAMPDGTGTEQFRQRFPKRFVDVGICEQHAITFAAGLASQGYRPFVAIYSTFSQRAYDQLIHDMAQQKLPVTVCLDRAGLVGEDGATHHGVFDVSFVRNIPNVVMLAPRDEVELVKGMHTSLQHELPFIIRYPKGAGLGLEIPQHPDGELLPPLPFTGEVLQKGKDVLIMAIGSMVHPALTATRHLAEEGVCKATVFDARWIKPLPLEQIKSLVDEHSHLIFVEENALAGGFSSAVLEVLADNGLLADKVIKRLGLPDMFIEHGPQKVLRAEMRLDATGIAASVRKSLAR